MKTLLVILVALFAATASAQDFEPIYKYRVQLRDKKNNPFSLKHPEDFLSEKSIERRRRQHLKLDETDLPITPTYIMQVGDCGVQVVNQSKWNNTLVVQTTDPSVMEQVEALPFVTGVRCVATYSEPYAPKKVDRFSLIKKEEPVEDEEEVTENNEAGREALMAAAKAKAMEELQEMLDANPNLSAARRDSIEKAFLCVTNFMIENMASNSDDEEEAEEYEEEDAEEVVAEEDVEDETIDSTEAYYGPGWNQVSMLGVEALHARGYKGEGMTIAICDGGFYNADIIPLLSNVRILGTRDFVLPGCNVFGEDSHGMMVLSCMAANQPETLVGTAPGAQFWLLRSEDSYTEQLVEEDNWCAAIEFADSVGVDLVNTSLGYTKFDNPDDNVRYWEQDGKTHIMSRSASMAASKGMVLCQSAGNEGDSEWKRIGVPADADNILTVGALKPNGVNTYFSSLGNTADGRIKPDVCAQGQNCYVTDTDGTLTQVAGTSFSSPIMCGAVACFWQAHPYLTASQIMALVRARGDNREHPDNVFGYGTPNLGAE